jgi:hypothetical protein
LRKRDAIVGLNVGATKADILQRQLPGYRLDWAIWIRM